MIYEGNVIRYKGLSIVTIADGSILNPISYGFYGGHFILFPFLVSFLHISVGYSIHNIFIFNTIISVLILLSFYIFKPSISKKVIFTTTVIFLCTPFIGIFHSSGLSETLSSLFVLSFFLNFLKLSKENYHFISSNTLLSLALITLAIITKRENATLFLFLLTTPLIHYVLKRPTNLKQCWIQIVAHGTIIIGIFWFFSIWSVEQGESSDLNASTFSITYLIQNLNALFLGLINPEFWGISGYLLIFGFVLLFGKWKNLASFEAFSAFILLTLFILVYSSHYRSYYQVKFGETTPFDSLRYAVNYFPIAAIFLSFLADKIKLKSRYFVLAVWTGSITIIFFILIQWNMRVILSEEEYFTRIQPVDRLTGIDANSTVITDIPSIFRSYLDSDVRVIDYFMLGEKRVSHFPSLQELDINDIGNNVYLVIQKKNDIDNERFGIANRLFSNQSFKIIDSTYSHNIYQLER